MTARESWKKLWRTIRVIRRETIKANQDLMLFGQGVVYLPNDGTDPRHVQIEQIRFTGGKNEPSPTPP